MDKISKKRVKRLLKKLSATMQAVEETIGYNIGDSPASEDNTIAMDEELANGVAGVDLLIDARDALEYAYQSLRSAIE